jgi:EAL domain-containing protein (putative c-di-GMP-specific phosphodiesterase class I)
MSVLAIDSDSDSLAQVMSAADAACYAAKEAGRNRVHFYHRNDHELTRQRSERQWIARINQAISDQRFVLYAQAIVPIVANGNTAAADTVASDSQEPDLEHHVEILLRMVDPNGELIPPGHFIPAAERYDLMTKLDRVVISSFFEAYAQACLSQSGRPLDRCLYAINLSARSLNDGRFVDFIKAQFVQNRVPPQIICFEITETAAILNLDKAAEFMRELKQMGCCFALDDFGSGMNCFAYLKQLDIDYLKIDGSFVKNIVNEPIDQALVSCMNRIAHAVGAKTVAEWVETDAILQTLQALGVDYAQGYGIGKPQPLENFFSEFLADGLT